MHPEGIVNEIIAILTRMAGDPADMTMTWIFLACGWIGFIVIMRLAGAALGFQRATIPMILLVSLVTVVSITAASIGIHRFLAPHAGTMLSETVMIYGGAAIAILILVLPLIMLIHQTKYIKALIATILAIAGAVGVIMLAQAAAGSLQSGEKKIEKAMQNKKMTEESAN